MEKDKLLKSLWLNIACGHRPSIIQKCVTELGGAEAVFDGKPSHRDMERVLGAAYPTALEKDLSGAERILRDCEDKGIRLVHISDDNYPDLLRNTPAPPQILYAAGLDINLNEYLTVAVVGSREASSDKLGFTRKLCKDIADSGAVIVSGMARGLDARAHLGALDAGGFTVAVLAGGVDIVYPASNRELYEKILKRGMIISEQPPGVRGRDYFYQERNRIIAGISSGVLISGGGEHSGTAITAKYAQMYDRDIFAVPGSPTDDGAALPNELIRDGAAAVLGYDDIISEYADRFGALLDRGAAAIVKPPKDENIEIFENKSKNKEKDKGKAGKIKSAAETAEDKMSRYDFSKFGPIEAKIVKYMCKSDGAVHIDEIIRNTELKTSDVNSSVVLLQLKGIIRQHAGNLYTLE